MRPAAGRAAARALAIASAVWLVAVTGHGQTLLSRDEALALVFPGATTTPERVFLTEPQMKAAGERAGAAIPSALVGRYIATKDGAVIGRAYVDTHVVRTKKETLLVSLEPSGTVKRVDVIAMLEPLEYRATQPFLGQFGGKRLQDDLRVQRAIRPIAGATLTTNAVTEAVRRVLAIDAVLSPAAGPKAAGR